MAGKLLKTIFVSGVLVTCLQQEKKFRWPVKIVKQENDEKFKKI